MGELYLVFLLIAVVLFGVIVTYSVMQKRRLESPEKQDYVDPLFAELEDSKKPMQQTDAGLQGKKPSQIEPKASPAKPSPAKPSPAKAQKYQQKQDPVLDSHIRGSHNTAGAGKVHDAGNVADAVPKAKEPADAASPNIASKDSGSQALDSKAQNHVQSSDSGADSSQTVDSLQEVEISGSPRIDSASSIVTELVARVKNPIAIEQQELLTLFRGHDFKFHRKVHIYGLNQLTDLWQDIEFELPSARFVELGVAIQLADREGAMSNKELHDFQQMALEFSNKFDAPFEFSLDIDEALKQAQILDQIGRRYDSMAVLNVVPRAKTGFRMADIESCARDLMMSADKNGIFVKTKGQKHNLLSLYRLACTDGSGHFGISNGTMTPVHDLVIYMNVPATPEPDRVFQEMVNDANNLATWLDGKVVDRNGKVMTQRSYTILMQQISDIAYSMQQDGLIPGDAVSKKLF